MADAQNNMANAPIVNGAQQSPDVDMADDGTAQSQPQPQQQAIAPAPQTTMHPPSSNSFPPQQRHPPPLTGSFQQPNSTPTTLAPSSAPTHHVTFPPQNSAPFASPQATSTTPTTAHTPTTATHQHTQPLNTPTAGHFATTHTPTAGHFATPHPPAHSPGRGSTPATSNTNASTIPAPSVNPNGSPTRVYINSKVTPCLLEGMKYVAANEPEKPLKWLAEFLAKKSAEVEGA